MTPYYDQDGITIYVGDNRDVLPHLENISAVVTDPPYGLSFMGKDWDHEVPGVAFWEAMREAMLPGAHLLSFGGSRTFHRIGVAIEDAGLELRDTLMWLYGQGFPKSHNLSGDWQGWGTALKPSFEPVILARKRLCGTVAANVLAHGTGALNIDASRIGTTRGVPASLSTNKNPSGDYGPRRAGTERDLDPNIGRWPANVLFDEAAAEALDRQSGERKSGKYAERTTPANRAGMYSGFDMCDGKVNAPNNYGDTGGASRFFYVAKASRKERGEGNNHPTVKPLALMRYLVTLVTPPGGIVLDPFAGSGSTLVACAELGFPAIGIEMNEEYAEIAARRVRHAKQQTKQAVLV